MEEIDGYIEDIIFLSPDNGFTVAKLKEPHKDKLTVITGYLSIAQPGETITCKGSWKYHPKHGEQFEVSSFEVESPADLVGIQKYLESGLIKGIGPSYAKKIVDKFGEETLNILDKTYSLFNSRFNKLWIKKEKKLSMIKEGLEKNYFKLKEIIEIIEKISATKNMLLEKNPVQLVMSSKNKEDILASFLT